eukprot:GHVQ01013986.1.p1 GENE.GHVQ01013986.1~~GHVQ01013986.1.p1  ORF type:complete len:360 (+),score=35.51 GHVQ01013986.1:250-1329(+)
MAGYLQSPLYTQRRLVSVLMYVVVLVVCAVPVANSQVDKPVTLTSLEDFINNEINKVVQVCLGADPSATNPYRDSKYFVDQPLSLAAISQDGGVAAVHRSFRRLMYWLQGGSRHPLHVESLLLRCVDEPNFAIRLGGPIREFVSRYFLDPEEGISRYTVGKEAAVSLDSSGKYSEQLQSGTRRRWNWEGFVNSSTLLSDEDRYVGRRAIEVLGGLVRNSNVSQVGGRVERDWLRVAETQRRSKEGNASKGVDNVESAEEVSKIGSAISLPLPFAVPGERFREMYYWDSYWIVRGLLLSGQLEAAQNIVQNFAWSIDRFGFIPSQVQFPYLPNSLHTDIYSPACATYMVPRLYLGWLHVF